MKPTIPDVLIRLTAPAYGDFLGDMSVTQDAMTIAHGVFRQSDDMPNSAGLSQLFTAWGQFVDHDLSHSPDASGEFVAAEGLAGPFERSVYDPQTGITGPREQVNTVTPAIDASMVYGSDETREALLRSFEGGRLKVDAGGMMPLAPAGTMAGSTEADPLFLAGDVRANENAGLTSLHTLFVREHNYWADRLAEARPHWTDHRVFETARTIVEYEIQKITYTDWLPHLIGEVMLPVKSLRHDPGTDGQVSNEFSTAAFRFGHTMVGSEIRRLEEDGTTSPGGHLTVREAFFDNSTIRNGGLGDLMRGAAATPAQESDTAIIDDLNLFLETPNGVSGFSLAALNILRGRDHGLDGYISVRAQLMGDIDPGRVEPGDFSVITSDPALAARLARVYDSVHEVDLWVGGLAEDNLAGTQLGPLFSHIVSEQFTRTAISDTEFMDLPRGIPRRFKKEVKQSGLDDIIERNSDVADIQEDVFVYVPRIAPGSVGALAEPIAAGSKPDPDAPEPMPVVADFPDGATDAGMPDIA